MRVGQLTPRVDQVCLENPPKLPKRVKFLNFFKKIPLKWWVGLVILMGLGIGGLIYMLLESTDNSLQFNSRHNESTNSFPNLSYDNDTMIKVESEQFASTTISSSPFETRSFFSTKSSYEKDLLKLIKAMGKKYGIEIEKGDNAGILYLLRLKVLFNDQSVTAEEILSILDPLKTSMNMGVFSDKMSFRKFAGELKKYLSEQKFRIKKLSDFYINYAQQIIEFEISTCDDYVEIQAIISGYLKNEFKRHYPNEKNCESK
jgi:hypothetical protein